MKTKLSILFYVKKAKAAAIGLVPIYARITINGKRIELSTNRFIEISKWSTEAGKMKGSSEEARSINNHLANGWEYSPRSVANHYQHITLPRSDTILPPGIFLLTHGCVFPQLPITHIPDGHE